VKNHDPLHTRPAVRRLSIAGLLGCSALLILLFLIPEIREQDLSAIRTSIFRIPKRKLAPFARELASTLPLLEIVITEDSMPVKNKPPLTALMRVFDSSDTNHLTDLPRALLPFVAVRHRGKSSMYRHFQQKSIRLKILDDQQKPSRFDLCGFPPDDDFILIANSMDRSIIRDRLANALAASVLSYTPQAKYVEVFVRKNSERLDEQTYQGVYLAIEKITEGPHRVAIGPLEMMDPLDELQGGGWLIHMDHSFTRQSIFELDNQSFVVEAPGTREMTPAALEFIRKDLTRFYRISQNASSDDSIFEELDIDSFIHMMLLQEFLKNRDAFLFSTYFYRSVGGRLAAGPAWDFNLSMGNSIGMTGPEGFLLTERFWARDLLRNPRFLRLYCETWHALRQPGGPFSDEHILDLIDSIVEELGPAADRHFTRYPELLNPKRETIYTVNFQVTTFEQNVQVVRDFLLQRGQWMDKALGTLNDPEELFSEEMNQVRAESEALGITWFNPDESPLLRVRNP